MHCSHVDAKQQQCVPQNEDDDGSRPVVSKQQRLDLCALQRALPDMVWNEADSEPDQARQQQQVIQYAQDWDEIRYEILKHNEIRLGHLHHGIAVLHSIA